MAKIKALFLTLGLALFLGLGNSPLQAKNKTLAPSHSDFVPKSFEAKIVQSFTSSVTGKVKRSHGVIKYQYPSNLRLEFLDGDQSIFVSNKEKTWYYNPPFDPQEKGEVTVQPSSQSPISKFFDTLHQGIGPNGPNEMYKMEQSADHWVLNFDPVKAKELGLKKATLNFPKGLSNPKLENFTSIILSYLDRGDVTLEFSQLKKDVSFSPNEFVFKMPTGSP